MFRSCTIISTSLTLLASLGWLGHLYGQRAGKKVTHSTHIHKSSLSGKQIREHVRKDIWIAQGPSTRLHNRIESEASTLLFDPEGEVLQIMETLHGVRCWIQERVQETEQGSAQQIRFFVAEDDVYDYRCQEFKASNVLLSLYRLPGTSFIDSLEPYTPFLHGNAEEVSFSVEDGSPRFKASHFTAFSQGKTL